jgi:threonine aldolase
MAKFSSDNASGISPEIMTAMQAANDGDAMAYGNDAITARLEAKIADLFESDCKVFPVATGTIANCLALASISKPYGAIFCHRNSHIEVDECGGPEFYSGGSKLKLLDGGDAKFSATDLETAIEGSGLGGVHHSQVTGVSMTQASELGTVYQLAEVKAIADVSHKHDLKLHMDGARFANAVATLGCSPAEATWKQGVDLMSFGATKNGAMAAEAVIFFNKDLGEDFEFHRKRAGQLASKMRFISAQLEAYVSDDLWLKNARHANDMAQKLAAGLAALPGADLFAPVEGNQVFVTLPPALTAVLHQAGIQCHTWEGDTVRFVASFNTSQDAVEEVIDIAGRHAA